MVDPIRKFFLPDNSTSIGLKDQTGVTYYVS